MVKSFRINFFGRGCAGLAILLLVAIALVTTSWSLSSDHPAYAKPLAAPLVVYVDDSWTGLSNGTVVDADPGPGVTSATIGTDAFATIQAGVNAVDSGGTVKVLAGTYPELVTVNKTITLLGAQHGVDGRTRTFVAANETIVNNAGGSFSIQANNVVLDGFTVQGTTGAPLGTGIYLSGLSSGYNIRNNIIRNNVFGLYLNSSGTTQTVIQQNLFKNNNNPGPANGSGIYSDQGLVNALIDNNLFTGHFNSAILITHVSLTNSNITISNNQATGANNRIIVGGTTNALITRNTVANSTSSGIYLFGDNNNITVLRNVVTNAAREGVRVAKLSPLGPNQNLHIDSNTLTGNGYGIRVEAGSLSSPIDANCNFIQGNTTGLRNDDPNSIDATLNWWGNATGPSHSSNPGGTGQSVVGSAVSLLPFARTPVACVGLVKTASPSIGVAGTRLTYTLVLSNAGARDAPNVSLTDTLPVSVTYASANPSPDSLNPPSWNVGPLAAGQTLTYTVAVTVDSRFSGTLINTATLVNAVPLVTATATATTSVTTAADLSFTKSDKPDPVSLGALLTYTLSITNRGPSEATGVVVTDTLPGDFTFGGISGTSWNCSHGSSLLTCTVVSLLVGPAPNIVITGTVPLTSSVITNMAGITSTTPDPSVANNSALITTTVQPAASPPNQRSYLPIIMKNRGP